MDRALEILSRYGFTIENQEYDEAMKIAVTGNTLMVENKEDDPDERIRKKILYAFLCETQGIHIGDEKTFHQVFQTTQMKKQIPGCLWEYVRLYTRLGEDPIGLAFASKPFLETVIFILDKINEKDPEMEKALKAYRFREKFLKENKINGEGMEIHRLFDKAMEELNGSPVLPQMVEELMDCLVERFGALAVSG